MNCRQVGNKGNIGSIGAGRQASGSGRHSGQIVWYAMLEIKVLKLTEDNSTITSA